MKIFFDILKKFVFVILLLFPCLYLLGVEPSVMSSGDWYKFTIERDGIYRINYSDLVNLGIKDPENVRIYGSGGGMLSETPDKNHANDLQEIPIWMNTAIEGKFQNGDYILFYGQGPVVWKYNKDKQAFEHELNLWDTQSCYFITTKPGGKKITTETSPTTPPSTTVTSFDERFYYEKENWNLGGKSGRNWVGEHFYETVKYSFSFQVPDLETTSPLWLNVSFMAKTNLAAPKLQVNCSGQQIAEQSLPFVSYNEEAAEANFNTSTFTSSSANLTVELFLNRNGVKQNEAEGYLNYLRLFARRKLNMSSQQLFFRDEQSVGKGRTTQFHISGGSSTKHVWDITDMHNIKRMNTVFSGGIISFSAATDSLREFVAFDVASDLLKPNFPKNNKIENQNLHGISNVDMIIVTHPNFLDAARELAGLHRERDGLAVETVLVEQVYNEFSSGMQDPAAIRNFMKYLYEKPSSIKLKYLLLMGAGTYDNKLNLTSLKTNFIVTYQSYNSWHKTDSYVSDDYFGILGDDEAIEKGRLVIGVGRIPVLTAEQANEVVKKIRRYMDASLSGDWLNMIGLLADAGDGNLHTIQSEKLAKYVDDNHQQYTVEKLYLEGLPREATVDGHRYPEIELQLNNLMNSGCLLVNYNGHGNMSGLSSGRIITNKSIDSWRNKLYPMFVAATCDFGRYDNEVISGGEQMMLSPNGGSIATIASTRLVLAELNLDFNQNFFRELLVRNEEEPHRLGDVVRRAKNASIESVNKLCFALLGDPALSLNIPTDSVHTFYVNDKHVSEPLDTLRANSTVRLKGGITGRDGNILNNFNGVVYFTLFDKQRERKTLNHSGKDTVLSFYTQTSTLYKGKTHVKNGEFELSFIMPRNIKNQYGFGKISYYAGSDDGRAAAGSFKITVGGSIPGNGETEGPQIRLFMNDTLFRDGGITDQNPILIALLQDDTGINTSEEGIGQNITAILSNDPYKEYNLNRFYEAELGAHNNGRVIYRFNNLPVGNYELWFTACDLENNLSEASIRFRVTNSTILKIDKLYNYPNPFNENTKIYFEFNMPDVELQVELQIFDISGRQLRSMKQSYISEGFTSGDFEWDGKDAGGNRMNSGIYPYRVILSTKTGQRTLMESKMVLYN